MKKQLDSAPKATSSGAKIWRELRAMTRRIRLVCVCVLTILAATAMVGCEANSHGLSLREIRLIFIATVGGAALALAAPPVASHFFGRNVGEPKATAHPLWAPILTSDSSYADAQAVLDENIVDLARWENEGGSVS